MVAITNAQFTAVTALGGGYYRVEKDGGVDGMADASAVSAPIAGDFALRVRLLTPGSNLLFGVSADPDESVGYAEMDFAAQFAGAEYYIYERGTWRPPLRAHDGTGWVVRSGSTLRYLIGEWPETALVARSVEGVDAPLAFDCTIATLGAVIEVRFDSPGPWSLAPVRPHRRLGLETGFQL